MSVNVACMIRCLLRYGWGAWDYCEQRCLERWRYFDPAYDSSARGGEL